LLTNEEDEDEVKPTAHLKDKALGDGGDDAHGVRHQIVHKLLVVLLQHEHSSGARLVTWCRIQTPCISSAAIVQRLSPHHISQVVPQSSANDPQRRGKRAFIRYLAIQQQAGGSGAPVDGEAQEATKHLWNEGRMTELFAADRAQSVCGTKSFPVQHWRLSTSLVGKATASYVKQH
jgi:hypothetical protein